MKRFLVDGKPAILSREYPDRLEFVFLDGKTVSKPSLAGLVELSVPHRPLVPADVPLRSRTVDFLHDLHRRRLQWLLDYQGKKVRHYNKSKLEPSEPKAPRRKKTSAKEELLQKLLNLSLGKQ